MPPDQRASTPSQVLWNTLIDLIGSRVQHASASDGLSTARRRPLFVLSDERVVLSNLNHALDCLWSGLETFARSHARFCERFQKHRARWLERKAAEYFRRVFPPASVHEQLFYPDPDSPGGSAELDLAVSWQGFHLLIEAKSKQFRLEGQLGDLRLLRTDLKANVEDAFHQA